MVRTISITKDKFPMIREFIIASIIFIYLTEQVRKFSVVTAELAKTELTL